jgi:hypothetical protein
MTMSVCKSKTGLALASVLTTVLVASGCSTTRTFVDYNQGALYSTESVGNVPYVEVGPASASERGFFWESCSDLAKQAVSKLGTARQERGASHVSSVRWRNHADGTYTDAPVCTTGWGWFTAALVGGFGPWVKAAEVQGRLVLADEPDLSRLNQNVSLRVAEHQRQLAEAEAARRAAEQAEQERIAAEKAAREAEKQAEKDRKAAEKAAARAAEEAAAQAERDRKAAEAAAQPGTQ